MASYGDGEQRNSAPARRGTNREIVSGTFRSSRRRRWRPSGRANAPAADRRRPAARALPLGKARANEVRPICSGWNWKPWSSTGGEWAGRSPRPGGAASMLPTDNFAPCARKARTAVRLGVDKAVWVFSCQPELWPSPIYSHGIEKNGMENHAYVAKRPAQRQCRRC